MSQEMNQEDTELIAQLRDALGEADPVPADVAEFAKAAFTWRDIDAELASIAFDSSTEDVPSGVRSTSLARMLSFEVGRWTVDIEYNQSTRRLIGQVEPGQRLTIELHFAGGAWGIRSDELGRFEFDDVSPGPVSLVIRTPGDLEVIKTEWTVL
jgi:hypothetical protein